MKNIFHIFLFVFAVNANAQMHAVMIHNESDRKQCKEIGHVRPDSFESTSMYCSPYVIDTDSTSIQVFPSCNIISYTCGRCGEGVSEKEKERRVLLWKKK